MESTNGRRIVIVLFIISMMAGACAPYHATTRPMHYKAKGRASWYGPGFAGRKTANGERFNPGAMTAAHRKLPFGTTVRVTHLENGKSVIVRINDRGPFIGGRIIDLSKAAAGKLDMLGTGTARVEVLALTAPGINDNTLILKDKKEEIEGDFQEEIEEEFEEKVEEDPEPADDIEGTIDDPPESPEEPFF